MEIEGPALVTGASRGLGRAVALELARCGFDVLATMRSPEAGRDLPRLARELEGTIAVERLDVRDPDSIRVATGLQVLVNNAGVETAYLPVETTPIEAWREVFETNVFGVVETLRRALPELGQRNRAVVCNVTSASLLFPMPFYAVYRASKAALAALGESLQAEMQAHGVRVVEVMPGPVETDMLAGSRRVPEAAAHEGYGALAQWAWQGRQAAEGAKTPADAAARRIVAAILDDGAPLRVACDPVGEGMIAGADAAPYEARLRGALDAMRSGEE